MSHPTRRRHGVTLTDVLVIAGVVGLLVFILVSLLSTARRRANHSRCPSNLRQIGQAMRQYAIDDAETGLYPRTRYDPADPTPRFFTNPMATNPFADDGPLPNDVTAAMWHLMRNLDLTPGNFICSEDYGAEAVNFKALGVAGKMQMSNFPGRENLSYSFANPYPTPAAEAAGWKWDDSLNSTMPVAADVNPGSTRLLVLTPDSGGEELRAGNSPNHGREGQNVCFADGSVRFVMTPFEGAFKDNIYTAGGPETLAADPPTGGVRIVSPPLTATDMVLLPTVVDYPRPGEKIQDDPIDAAAYRSSAWKFVWYLMLPGFAVGAVLVVLMMLWANRARRRKLDRGELPDMPPRE